MFAVINDAARAYRGHVPDDCLHEPYMSEDELRGEIAAGVRFFGWFEDGELLGVMGIQDVQDVTLIRHAYVATRARRGGIGGKLLRHLLTLTEPPGAGRHLARRRLGHRLLRAPRLPPVGEAEKNRLLRRYWSIPARQIETSVVLVGPAGGESPSHADRLFSGGV
jgi:GNAT superfamily N-acetyltransferase